MTQVARVRDLYEQLRTAEGPQTIWLWGETPRLREHQSVGWKLVVGVGWKQGERPPSLDSDKERIFVLDRTIPMGLDPDEFVEYVWADG